MRAIVQRVRSAEVRVGGKVVGACGPGLVLLLGAHRDDTEACAEKMADKIAGLRIFGDAEGKMNLAIKDRLGGPGDVLAVSNFTVYGDTGKNRRPSFIEAAPFEEGKRLFERFVEALRGRGIEVRTGVFGAMMDVELVNDGPVTVIVEA